MNDALDKLEVNPKDLWRAGAIHLPLAATDFAEWATTIDSTTSHHEEAFNHMAFQAGCGTAWQELHYQIQSIVATTSTNLKETGKALRQIAVEYAEQDAENGKELLETYKDELSKDPALPDPPKNVPDAPMPEEVEPDLSGPGGW